MSLLVIGRQQYCERRWSPDAEEWFCHEHDIPFPVLLEWPLRDGRPDSRAPAPPIRSGSNGSRLCGNARSAWTRRVSALRGVWKRRRRAMRDCCAWLNWSRFVRKLRD